MTKAAHARSKGRRKKALALYEAALDHEEAKHEVHARMAPLLAETQQLDRARRSFRIAACGFESKGFLQKAEAMWLQATQHLPGLIEVWENLAQNRLAQQRPTDAQKVLYLGSKNFRKGTDRKHAVTLLRAAFAIEAYQYDVTVSLAGMLAATGERGEALELLAELAPRCVGRSLRKVRGLEFRLAPSPKSAWRWLKSALT